MSTTPSLIETEQEAAVAILFSCLSHNRTDVHKNRLEHISRMLLLSSKFSGLSLPVLANKALPLVRQMEMEAVMAHCATYISDHFRETLFAMICELITDDGKMTEEESETIGVAALYLGISIEMMQVMVNTFLIRNRYNV